MQPLKQTLYRAILFFVLALVIAGPSRAQIYFPGNERELWVYGFDGSGPQIFDFPTVQDKFGLDFDLDGTLLISVGTAIQRFSTTGEFLGNFATGLNAARDLAVADDGTVLVVAVASDGIRRYDNAGNFLGEALAGVGLRDYIALDRDGNAYVSTVDGQQVLRLARGSNTFTTFIDGSDPFNRTLARPEGLTFDADGNLYVSNSSVGGNGPINSISQFSPDGAFLGLFVPFIRGPRDLAFGPDGSLYAVSVIDDGIHRFNAAGTLEDVFSVPANSVSFIATPRLASGAAPEPGSVGLALLAIPLFAPLVRRRS